MKIIKFNVRVGVRKVCRKINNIGKSDKARIDAN